MRENDLTIAFPSTYIEPVDGHGATRVDLEGRVFPDKELDLLRRRELDRFHALLAGDAAPGTARHEGGLGAGHRQGGREEHEGSGAHP